MKTDQKPFKVKHPAPELTKLTVSFFQPMYWRFDQQMTDALLRRDAFLNRVMANEIQHIETDLADKRMSAEAHRYVARRLKRMGGDKAGELWPVSISVSHNTANELRRVTEKHNLVRDALVNRIVMLLWAPDMLLKTLELPLRLDAVRSGGSDDMPISPLKAIEEVQYDPFYYLRIACEQRYRCGLYAMPLPESLDGFACYIPDDGIPGTAAHEARMAEDKAGASESDFVLFELDDPAPGECEASIHD